MSTSGEVLKQMRKDFGASTVKKGNEGYEDTPRIPTGIFALDLAIGGGLPMGRVSTIYGPESSNKTNVVLKAIAQGQRIYPDKKAVFIDAENSYDEIWASKMGVITEDLLVCSPEYAEQAVNMIEAFLYADDVFCVVLDSIAALSTYNELESDAEKASVGGASLVISKLYKKATASFNRMRNQGLMPPAFIGINQTRFKIGSYGDPETMPGGNSIKFASSCIIRLYGKNEMDKKIHPVMPAYKKTNVIVKKWKFPILATTAEFMMQMVPGAGREPGTIEDWNTVSNYLKELDYLSKAEKNHGWILFDETFKTLAECKARLYGDPDLLASAKAQIISELLELEAKSTESSEDEDGDDE